MGGAGVALLAGGIWFAGRAVLALGPVLLVTLAVSAIGAGLLVAAAVLSTLSPTHVAEDAQALARTLEAMGRGDLAREPEARHHAGPLDPVAGALRRAHARLRETLGTARGAAREAAQRSEELGTQCSTAHVAAQRVAEQGAHVAEQASVAAEHAREVHGALAHLGTGLAHLEGAARSALEHATRTTGAAARAATDLRDAATGLEELTGRFAATTTELAGLGRSVEDVQEFVSLVRKMARQSKLLSLNAAMEAARAGETGSGFGVVAAEVRRLARSSSDAADRTEQLLRDLFTRAGVAQEASRETLALARAAHESVERSRVAVAELRPDLAAPGASRDSGFDAPGATLATVAARQEQLAAELAALAQAARDSRLAGSAQVARVQDLIAASHSLGRSASRAAAALHELRLDATGPTAAVPGGAEPLGPVALSPSA